MGGKVGPSMPESVHKWREQARHLPADALNLLIVMLDDADYGRAGTFGGEIATPTLYRLANEAYKRGEEHVYASFSSEVQRPAAGR